jgi:hypothetical protein
MYRHAYEEEMSAAPEEANGDALSLKLSNGMDPFIPKKLITANVNSAQERSRVSGIDLRQGLKDICHADIDLTGLPSLSGLGSRAELEILHICESFSSEKLFRYVLRSRTKAAALV